MIIYDNECAKYQELTLVNMEHKQLKKGGEG